MPLITAKEFQRISYEKLPFAQQMGFQIEHIDKGTATARARYQENYLRPGGTISGPILMGLADYAMYAAVLSLIGPVELAVTTNLNINFLRRPSPSDVVADARVLKLGKRLAVGEVTVFSQGEQEPVAHVTTTYSIPPHQNLR